MENQWVIREARTEDLDRLRALFREYATELGVDLEFQGFEQELRSLPGAYAPPTGTLLLAEGSGEVVGGCVALQSLDQPGLCEMKRLYVRPILRGMGLGRRLARAVLARAREMGYVTMRLDTLRSLTPAVALYRSLGFVEIDPYYDNPLPGVVYMERSIAADSGSP